MKFRYPFPDKVERFPGDDTLIEGKSLTKASEADACDINQIVQRYMKDGVLEHVRSNPGVYDDVATSLEFQDALELVRNAQYSFAIMPAEIRARFDNDPAQFLRFVDENEDFLFKLGIVPGPESAAAEAAAAVAAPAGELPAAAPAAPAKK